MRPAGGILCGLPRPMKILGNEVQFYAHFSQVSERCIILRWLLGGDNGALQLRYSVCSTALFSTASTMTLLIYYYY